MIVQGILPHDVTPRAVGMRDQGRPVRFYVYGASRNRGTLPQIAQNPASEVWIEGERADLTHSETCTWC